MLFFLVLALLLCAGCGLYTSGRKSSPESWLYIERFAFVPREGFELYMGNEGSSYAYWSIYHNYDNSNMSYVVENPLQQKHVNNSQQYGGLWVLGYPIKHSANFEDKLQFKGGSDSDYVDSYKGMSCSERIEYAKIKYQVSSSGSTAFDPSLMSKDDEYPTRNEVDGLYKWHWELTIPINETNLGRSEAKLVYWVLANCGVDPSDTSAVSGTCEVGPENPYCQGSIDVYFHSHFYHQFDADKESSTAGGRWTGRVAEISYEMIGVGIITAICWALQTLVVIPAAVFTGLALWAKQRMHMTVWMLLFCIACQFIGFVLMFSYMIATDITGRYAPRNLYLSSVLFFQVADTGLVTLFLCLAGGYTVTRRKLKMAGRIRLVFFVTAYFTCKFAALVWYSYVASEGKQYLLESAPGVMSLVLVCFAYVRFYRTTWVTVSKWPEHSNFYYKLRVLGSIYLLHLPIVNIIGTGIGEMFRVKFIWIANLAIIVFCTFCLVLIYHPRLFPSSFPFHAQIEDMKAYKLKKEEEKYSSPDQEESRSVVSFTGGGGSYSPTRSVQGSSVRSFTGGTSQSAAKIDSQGKIQPLSYFDRKQIRQIKKLTEEVDAVVAGLNEYSHSLNEILEQVNCEETDEMHANLQEVTHSGSIQEDISKFEAYRKQRTLASGKATYQSFATADYMARNATDDPEAGQAKASSWKDAKLSPTKSFSMNMPREDRGVDELPGDRTSSTEETSELQDSKFLSYRQKNAIVSDKLWSDHEKGSSADLDALKSKTSSLLRSEEENSPYGDEIDETEGHIPRTAFTQRTGDAAKVSSLGASPSRGPSKPPKKNSSFNLEKNSELDGGVDSGADPNGDGDQPKADASPRMKGPAPAQNSPYALAAASARGLPPIKKTPKSADAKLSQKQRYWLERQLELEKEAEGNEEEMSSYNVDEPGDDQEM